MARYYGANADFGLAIETTFGTAVSPPTNSFVRGSHEVSINPITVRPADLRQSSRFSRTPPVEVRREIDVSFSGHLLYDFQGPMLKAILGGTSATTGGGPYVHTYIPAYELPSYTIEADLGDSGNSRIINGCTQNMLTLNFAGGELVTFKSDWIGRQAAAPAAGYTATYATTQPVVRSSDCVITWNSLTLTTDAVKSGTITINNNLTRLFALSSAFTRTPYTSGERTIEIKLEVEYGSTIANAFATAAEAQTQSDFVLTATSGANIIAITIRNAFVFGDSLPKNNTADPLNMSVTLIGVADSVDPTVTIVVTNASSSNIANA